MITQSTENKEHVPLTEQQIENARKNLDNISEFLKFEEKSFNDEYYKERNIVTFDDLRKYGIKKANEERAEGWKKREDALWKIITDGMKKQKQ